MPAREVICTKCGGTVPLTLNLAATEAHGVCPNCQVYYSVPKPPPADPPDPPDPADSPHDAPVEPVKA